MLVRWLANRSFRFNLSATTLLALLALLALLIWQTWVLLETELRSQLRATIDNTSLLLGAAVAIPLAQRDHAALGDIATQIVAERNQVDYIAIEDHAGRKLAMVGIDPGKSLPAPSTEANGFADRHIHVRGAVILAGQKLGEYQYGVSLAFIDESRNASALKLLRTGAVGVLFGLLLLVPLGLWLSRRLTRLEVAAQRLADGHLDERIDLPGRDEISRLANAFNHMADSLATKIDALQASETRFHHAVQGSNDGIWDWDIDKDNYYFSPRHKLMLGYRDDEVANTRETMESLVLAEDLPLLTDAMRRHFEERQPFDCIFRMCHRDGHVIWCRSRGQAIWNARGEVVRFSGATSDITEQKQAAVALEHLAHFDGLTQLPNRTLLADRMAMAMAQARRKGERLAVALLDLDGFKPINDNFGHDAGDLILIEVAARLRATLREVDTVARLGGDEFVLVLAGQGDAADFRLLLKRVLAALAEPYVVPGAADTAAMLSGSIGVTFFPDDDADADTLIRHADQAMYVAKQAGRNRYHVFDTAMDRDAQQRTEARRRIAAALAADEFCLYYQPKVDLRAGRVIGAEALIRWQHPERGLVPPGEFLPLVEDGDFAIRLSEWVIETALVQLAQWRDAGLAIDVSVNLPAHHLQSAGFVDFLAAALARHPGATPAAFELEVLESAALDDVAGVSARMQQCRQLGVRFALDDFGTGYASLAYLRRLPIELLKIDQSFVRDMLQDPDDLAIVEGVIGLASAFRDAVIAEGVETVHHGVMLLHLGCDLAQGYGIARPMPAAHLPAWVAAWQPDPAFTRAAQNVLARSDLALISAEVEHRRWIDTLSACITQDQEQCAEPPPLDERACRFGCWLHGDGRRYYGGFDEFPALDALHEQVHGVGRRLIGLCSEGERERARRELPALFACRDALLDKLGEMIIAVAKRSARTP